MPSSIHGLIPWHTTVSGFRIVVVLSGVLALGVFTLAVDAFVRHGGASPSFGWTDAPGADGWVVDSVDAAGPAAGRIRVGDRLISFDGDARAGRYGARFYRLTSTVGTRYTLRLVRDGAEVEETLTVGATRARPVWGILQLLAGFVWFGVGLVIGWLRPDDTAVRLGFAAAVGTGIVYLQLNLLPEIAPGGVWAPLHMIVAYHFFLRFPRRSRRERGWELLLWLFYGWGVAACALRQPLNWTFYTGGAGATAAWVATHPPLPRVGVELGYVLTFPLTIAIVALVATTYRRLTDPQGRRQIRWVAWTSVVGLSPVVLWGVYALLEGAGPESPHSLPGRAVVGYATLLGTTLVPLGIAYAVVRHRVFDIAVVVRRGMQYLLAKRALQILLAIPAIVLVATAVAQRDHTVEQLFTENILYLSMIAAAALSLRFRQPMAVWLDRRFFREQYDRERLLVGLLDDLRRLAQPAAVSHLVRTQIDLALHPSHTALWFQGEPDPPPEALLQRITREGAGPDTPLSCG
ncbi:MAG TPA: hypothetical protein VE173_15230, partial [Longimicrobiales bacterium]|nr:hypothetical protein [Longimicrobiales bacterium]